MRNGLFLLRWQIVQVLVHGVAGVALVLDAVEPRHQQGGKRQVRVGRRIRKARLDAPGLRARHPGDANRGRAVARRVRQQHRRLEVRHQALVAVGGGVGEGVQRLGMVDDAADVVQGRLRQSAVAFAREQVRPGLRQRLVYVHAAAVVADQRLGHEGRGLAVAVGDVVDHVLEYQQLVGLAGQAVEAGADLALPGGRHLVVMDFGDDAHLLQRQAHGRADVLQAVYRGHREVAALDAWAMAEVAAGVGLLRVPACLRGIDTVERPVDTASPLHVVEDEELRLRAEIGGIGDPGRFQIRLGAARQRARVASVALQGVGLDHIATQIERGLLVEGVDHRRVGVRHQYHVGVVDAFPAADG